MPQMQNNSIYSLFARILSKCEKYIYIYAKAFSAYSLIGCISTNACKGQRSSSSRKYEKIPALVESHTGNVKSR